MSLMLQILTEPGECYVVDLSAVGGMALAAVPGTQCATALNGGSEEDSKGRAGGTRRGSIPGATSLEDRLAELRLRQLLQPQQSQPPYDDASASGGKRGSEPDADARISQQQQPPPQQAEVTEKAHDDPLRRASATETASSGQREEALPRFRWAGNEGEGSPLHSGVRRGEQGRSSAGGGGGAAAAAVQQPPAEVRLFTGFVSYEQLEVVIGNRWERRAAARKEMTHWVKMHGPGERHIFRESQ